MSLLSNQAIAAAMSPPNYQKVKKGEKYTSRLKILTEPFSSEEIQEQSAWNELTSYLRNTLTSEKYQAISKFFTFPLSAVNISNDILTDLFFVFHGKNAAFNIDYPNARFKDIAESVLSELGIRSWIEENGKKVLKCSPNAVVVIDLDDKGNPMLLNIPNNKLMGYEFKTDCSFDFVVFEHSRDKENKIKRVAVYDDEYYRVIDVENGRGTMVTENAHNLGYCPAKFFFDKPLNEKYEFNRAVPLSSVTGVLSEWAIFEAFILYAHNYGAFPAIEYADSGCEQLGCEGGIIQSRLISNDNDNPIYTQPSECPSCAKKGFIGPGTAIGVSVSEDASVQDTRGILRFVVPDVTSLKHLGEYQDRKENFIKVSVAGYNNVTTKEAVNESQVKYLKESRLKPILDIKKHLEELYKWIAKTTVKLLYDVDIKVSANFGTEFFILTESDLLLLITAAKAAGVQSSEIAELNQVLIQTKYKNDPHKARRMLIAADVEPSPYDSRAEVKEKFSSGMISREDYFIKLNFIDLLAKFERENGDIVQFGSEIAYSKKIEKIKNTLLFYTNQMLINESTEQVQGSGTGVI